ncbi:zinc metallopeptidase [Oceanobacter sp. 5_MG-2023]|jgi:Zn-dependent membrane protease YugP|uniref:zinc metallopeptidase n=1 Tax=Oceanobacter sp. 5_MG-2023 TaxID=3062645 RepID=UPI0026E3208C|nr:zinc metallopeptidase [Oceanobacter sp. 5_MG-2023]MDO6682836.1 zinc metallopeptidase [Oceanobacter sp. 5_MG-2023]
MLMIAGVVILLLVLVLPGLWVRHVLTRHSSVRDDFPGTGGDMARHLIHKLELEQVVVEATEQGDHYDPQQHAVRLTADKLDGKSLTAVVVAAHEVGHALQHQRGERMFSWRQGLAVLASWMQRLAPVALLLSPLLLAVQPGLSRWTLLIAVLAMSINTLVHLVTLPVELDASFNKALPLLQQGQYLDDADMLHARTILRAAALTYVAGSLMSLLNIWRWLRYLRR